MPYPNIEPLEIPAYNPVLGKKDCDNTGNVLFQRYQEQLKINQPLYQEPLRIIVMGGDQELFNLLQVLGELFKAHCDSKHFELFDNRIYLIPTRQVPLANYIATKDHWYQRYLYLPFMKELLVPKFEFVEQKDLAKLFHSGTLQGNPLTAVYKKSDPFGPDKGFNSKLDDCQRQSQCIQPPNSSLDFMFNHLIIPFEYLMNCMYSYIREAENFFNISVYQVKCEFVGQSSNMNQKQNPLLAPVSQVQANCN